LLKDLKKAIKEKVIRSASVRRREFKSQNMVVGVCEALATDRKSPPPAPPRTGARGIAR
jgi:dGTPase